MASTSQTRSAERHAQPETVARSTAAFTPGPWSSSATYVYSKNGTVCVVGEPRAEKFIGYTALEFGSGDADEAYANASLIAAAPDMLEALSSALSHIEIICPDSHDVLKTKLRAAVAKATKES